VKQQTNSKQTANKQQTNIKQTSNKHQTSIKIFVYRKKKDNG